FFNTYGGFFNNKMIKENVFVVIAAFNEDKSIVKVISALKKFGYTNIVVVDDGSSDKTFDVVFDSGVFVLRHFINRGQGAALQTGIDFALSLGADFIVTFDADGQHHVEDIERLLKPVINGYCEVSLGSRFLKKDSNTPFIRRLVLKVGIMIVWLMYGIKLSDSHNGFRVFSRCAAQKIRITSDRMEHASQIVEDIHKKNISFREVPVTITYTNYSLQKGQSSLNSIKIGLRMILRKLIN
ncbi:MAG: glycosyltransferase family 2 protein, partial [Nanoarchaeota archaeon]|nr:glycosyltransferase family 2 protein [Nanoarchaeota archaeon]